MEQNSRSWLLKGLGSASALSERFEDRVARRYLIRNDMK